ncbi:MAG: alpha/beta hydrolase [Gammaproteobacteria bacterium]
MRLWVKSILFVLCLYISIIALLYAFQSHLIYQPNTTQPYPHYVGVPDMYPIPLNTSDKLRLTSWYKPALHQQPTLIYFQGNSGHIGDRGFTVRPFLDRGIGVMLVGFRGYGGNPGTPSERGWYEDGRTAIHYLLEQGISPQCMILFGESLGTGVAVQLATEYDIGALILRSPFSSLTDLASHHYPLVPVKLLMHDQYNNLSKIKTLKKPLLVFHGQRDTIIPLKYTKRFYQAAQEPKSIWIYSHGGHNNLDHHDMTKRTMAFIMKQKLCGEKNEYTN